MIQCDNCGAILKDTKRVTICRDCGGVMSPVKSKSQEKRFNVMFDKEEKIDGN